MWFKRLLCWVFGHVTVDDVKSAVKLVCPRCNVEM